MRVSRGNSITAFILTLLLAAVPGAQGSEAKSGSSGGGSVEAAGGLKMETEAGTPATKNSDTVTWKGCDGTFKAQMVDENGKATDKKQQDCGEIKQMDKGLATALAKAMPYCLRKGGKDDSIKEIKVDVMGCFADRNKNVPGGGSTEKSEHAEGRALDVKALHVKYSDGSSKDFNFNINEGEQTPAEDVDKLRKCWSDAVHGLDSAGAEAMGIGAAEKLCGGGGGASAQNGEANKVSGTIWSDKKSSLPPKNSLHDNHLHIECLSKDKG